MNKRGITLVEILIIIGIIGILSYGAVVTAKSREEKKQIIVSGIADSKHYIIEQEGNLFTIDINPSFVKSDDNSLRSDAFKMALESISAEHEIISIVSVVGSEIMNGSYGNGGASFTISMFVIVKKQNKINNGVEPPRTGW